jgi:hypothetical protein
LFQAEANDIPAVEVAGLAKDGLDAVVVLMAAELSDRR